jgi:hypothetical protein
LLLREDRGAGGKGGGEVLSASHCLKNDTANQSKYELCGLTLSPLEVNSVSRNNRPSIFPAVSARSSTLSSIISSTESGS